MCRRMTWLSLPFLSAAVEGCLLTPLLMPPCRCATSSWRFRPTWRGSCAGVLRRDRLSTRETVQNLTHSLHLLHEGDLMAIPIDPSSLVTGT